MRTKQSPERTTPTPGPDTTDLHQEIPNILAEERWVDEERHTIESARLAKTAWIAALGLSAPDHAHDVEIALAVASVDRVLRWTASDEATYQEAYERFAKCPTTRHFEVRGEAA